MITLVLGGARSGKSAVAEERAGSGDVVYVATGVATDADMAARIALHQARRPPTWRTIETIDLVAAVREHGDGTVLIDSLGTWVASTQDFHVDGADLCSALAAAAGDIVIVSEEVGMGVHPESAVGRQFRDAIGSLNRSVADIADEVVLVVAGRQLRLQ
ncbi:MAG: bifunctional adenosylcobinamide kinase/adenosylcobinamide-phosphate guanylyltransferase [Acidobacteria bacterium]|nr:bifunctional adenosylcobinamide kinase/adenosylcobinamide-phosphate guanylyltransferase [Acidobacteriota bacterium]